MVHTVYIIPRGKTIPQYCGSYTRGKRLSRWRHAPRMHSRGIHHDAKTQKNRVKPLRNGSSSCSSDHCPALRMSVAPASVVIATAPILIH
jgi:hypothetical protein